MIIESLVSLSVYINDYSPLSFAYGNRHTQKKTKYYTLHEG